MERERDRKRKRNRNREESVRKHNVWTVSVNYGWKINNIKTVYAKKQLETEERTSVTWHLSISLSRFFSLSPPVSPSLQSRKRSIFTESLLACSGTISLSSRPVIATDSGERRPMVKKGKCHVTSLGQWGARNYSLQYVITRHRGNSQSPSK